MEVRQLDHVLDAAGAEVLAAPDLALAVGQGEGLGLKQKEEELKSLFFLIFSLWYVQNLLQSDSESRKDNYLNFVVIIVKEICLKKRL